MTTVHPRARLKPARLLLGLLLGLLLPPASTALAHGHVEAGDYEIEIGFLNEPAYQGEPNGLDLKVMKRSAADAASTPIEGATPSDADHDEDHEAADDHDHASGEAEEGEAIEGLEDTLQAEVIHGKSQKTLSIVAQPGKPGAYSAALIPLEAGDYTWRVFGTIEGQDVDVSLTSGPGSFDAVESREAVSFPEEDASAPDPADEIAALDDRVSALTSANRTALGVGALGTLLGLIALVSAGFGARRKAG